MANQVLATWQEILISNPISFFAGMLVGVIASNRWKIIKRNGKPNG